MVYQVVNLRMVCVVGFGIKESDVLQFLVMVGLVVNLAYMFLTNKKH